MSKNSTKEKLLRHILLTYLILGIIGSSAISAGEACYFEYSSDDDISSGRYFSSARHTIDWLAGDVLTIRKAHGYSNSQSRNGLLRVITLAGTIATAIYLVGENLKILKNDNIPIIKNLIILRLRI